MLELGAGDLDNAPWEFLDLTALSPLYVCLCTLQRSFPIAALHCSPIQRDKRTCYATYCAARFSTLYGASQLSASTGAILNALVAWIAVSKLVGMLGQIFMARPYVRSS